MLPEIKTEMTQWNRNIKFKFLTLNTKKYKFNCCLINYLDMEFFLKLLNIIDFEDDVMSKAKLTSETFP